MGTAQPPPERSQPATQTPLKGVAPVSSLRERFDELEIAPASVG